MDKNCYLRDLSIKLLTPSSLRGYDKNDFIKIRNDLKKYEISELLNYKLWVYKLSLKYGILTSDSIVHRHIVEDMEKENVTIEENNEIPWDFTVV
jgi:hypothetical protein